MYNTSVLVNCIVSTLMRFFHELKVIGSCDEQERLIQVIESNLCDGWIKNKELELKRMEEIGQKYQIFTRSNIDMLPKAHVFFSYDQDKYLQVSNVIFEEKLASKYEYYNIVLEEFAHKFIYPYYEQFKIRIIHIKERTIDNSMSSELAIKFRNLLGANQAGLHPYDVERFMSFIIQAHTEKSLLEEDKFSELLIDEEWCEEMAEKMAINYNFGRELLKKFDPN